MSDIELEKREPMGIYPYDVIFEDEESLDTEKSSAYYDMELGDIDLRDYSSDGFGDDDISERVAEDDAETEALLAEAGQFIDEFNRLCDTDKDGVFSDPILSVMPSILQAASDPEIDGWSDPLIIEFFDSNFEDDILGKTSALPLLGLGLGAAARGIASKLAPSIGVNMGLRGLGDMAGGMGNIEQQTIPTENPVIPTNEFGYDQFGYPADPTTPLAAYESSTGLDGVAAYEGYAKKAADEKDLNESMREQVINALRVMGDDIKNPEVQEEIASKASSVWYALMALAQSAEDVTTFQTVLQCIPEQYHNAIPDSGVPAPEGGAPGTSGLLEAIDEEVLPGPEGDLPAEPPGPGVPPIDDGVDPIGMVGDTAGPVGGAEGSGIDGGPGRRSSSVSEEEFWKEALNFEAIQPANTQGQPEFVNTISPVDEQTKEQKLRQHVQTLVNSGMSVEQAYVIAGGSFDADQTTEQVQQPIQQVVTARAEYSLEEQSEFIDEPGRARNIDKLNLEDTHYSDVEEYGDEPLFLL